MPTKRLYTQLWLCFLCFVGGSILAEQQIPLLDLGSQVFSNVVVTSKTHNHIFIQHSRGFAALKIVELSDDALSQLGYKVVEKKPPLAAVSQSVSQSVSNLRTALKVPEQFNVDPKVTQTNGAVSIEFNNKSITIDDSLVKAVAAFVAILYVVFCYAATLICRKCGLKPAIWCWIPIIQMIFLLRAAGMRWWLILFWLLPVTNLFVSIVWCVKICRARGRGPFTVLCLLFPPTAPLAFLSLAVGSKEQERGRASNKVQLAYQQAA